jgi:hypothetical protein
MQFFIKISLLHSDCVHIYLNNLIQLDKQQWVGAISLFKSIYNHTLVSKGGSVIFPI